MLAMWYPYTVFPSSGKSKCMLIPDVYNSNCYTWYEILQGEADTSVDQTVILWLPALRKESKITS